MYAVIMSGGQGTRLWPLSRQKKPKQLHALAGEKPLIRETYERLLPVFKAEQIIISTIPEFVEEIKKLIPEIPEENYVVEPVLMGNAAACGLVTKVLNIRDPKSAAVFLPADHIISDKKTFIKTIEFAEELITKYPKHVLTIGVNPTKPDVSLGYIRMDSQIAGDGDLKAFTVKEFVEKPDLQTAKKYVSSWDYLWNAGMFIWQTDHMLKLFKQNLPKTFGALEKIGKALGSSDEKKVLKEEYKEVDNTSIDYGILEKTKDILVIPADFGWSDVGSWGSLLEVLGAMHGTNVITRGHHIGVDNENCLVMANDKLIATVGLKNIAIIDTPDAILICDSSKSHKVKDLLNKFKEEGKHLYL